MATRTSVATSTFTGTNGNDVASFTQTNGSDGAIRYDTNKYENPFTGFADAYWSGAGTFTNDQYATAVVTGLSNPGGNNAVGIVLRCSTDTGAGRDCYRIYVYEDSTTAIKIDKVVNGTVTNLATTSVGAFANGDTVEGEVEGTTLRAYRNGVQVGTDITDSALTTGKPGVCGVLGFGPGLFGDDWVGGNLTASAAGQPTSIRGSGVPGMRLGGQSFGRGW